MGCSGQLKIIALTLMGPLQGSLPPQWAALSSLSTLALNTNNLTRTLPAAFATMDSLERAYLYSNFLTGAETFTCVQGVHASQHAIWDFCQRCAHSQGGSRRTATTSAAHTLVLSLSASRVRRLCGGQGFGGVFRC